VEKLAGLACRRASLPCLRESPRMGRPLPEPRPPGHPAASPRKLGVLSGEHGEHVREKPPRGCSPAPHPGPAGHTCPERTPALPKDIGTMWRAVPGGAGVAKLEAALGVRRR
jgi:hypothetical protein